MSEEVRDLLGRPVRTPRAVKQGELGLPFSGSELEELARRAREANTPKTTERDPFTIDLFEGGSSGQ